MSGQITRIPYSVEKTPQEIRQTIFEFEALLAQVPGAVFGDSTLCPVKHSFADGIYVREIFIPKGVAVTGKIHKHEHPNFLLQGEVLVVTEHEGLLHIKAPLSMISKAGTKRALLALEDTIWVTVHANPTNCLDPDELVERYLTVKEYRELGAHQKSNGTSLEVRYT